MSWYYVLVCDVCDTYVMYGDNKNVPVKYMTIGQMYLWKCDERIREVCDGKMNVAMEFGDKNYTL